MLASAAKLHVRQIKRTVEFLITNGVKTLNKLRAIKFEDLLFNNTSPQACCKQRRRAGALIVLSQAVKILIREALEAIQNEKRMRLPGTWERGSVCCMLRCAERAVGSKAGGSPCGPTTGDSE